MNSAEREYLIYILSFCLTAKLLTPSQSSHLYYCFRMEKKQCGAFGLLLTKTGTEGQWRSCCMLSADEGHRKGTLGQRRMLSLYLHYKLCSDLDVLLILSPIF